MFINTKVFDPALEGKAVSLSGSLIEGNFIICKVNNYSLEIVGAKCNTEIPMSDFEHHAVEMVVLETPKRLLPELPKENEISVMETLPEIDFIKPIHKHKTGFTRKQGAKNFRSDLQIKVDNNHLEYLLQENIEPLRLEEILKRMQVNHGHWHWNSKNASSFVNFAIKCGKRIKKAGYGLYGYNWEAAE